MLTCSLCKRQRIPSSPEQFGEFIYIMLQNISVNANDVRTDRDVESDILSLIQGISEAVES